VEQYEVRLAGPAARGARIEGAALGALISALAEGTQRALRLRVDGRSRIPGPIPQWLRAAAHFDVTGIRAGSTILQIEAPTLLEAVPERFAQKEVFPSEFNPNESAVSLMDASLADALAGKTDSELYDDDLIRTFEQFGDVINAGFKSLEILGSRPVSLDPAAMACMAKLRESTPAPRRVRVAGWIDAIRWSDLMFTIVLEGTTGLRGVATGDQLGPEDLRHHFGKKVIIAGNAVFKPSGRVLRIEADQMQSAHGDISMWSVVPKPLDESVDVRALTQPQGPKTGLNAVFGRWPGDESDDDVTRALREVS